MFCSGLRIMRLEDVVLSVSRLLEVSMPWIDIAESLKVMLCLGVKMKERMLILVLG